MIKKLIITALIISLAASGCGSKEATVNEAVSGEIELKDNQTLITGQVTAISGNEVVLALAEEASGEFPSEEASSGEVPSGEVPSEEASSEEESSGEESSGEVPSEEVPSGEVSNGEESSGEAPGGEMPSGEAPSGEMPSGEAPSGEMPSGEAPSGEMPSGEAPSGEMPSGEAPSGEIPSGEAPSGEAPSGEMPGRESRQEGDEESTDNSVSENNQAIISYVLTGEERTITIPVGTQVTTLLGTVSTFSRIAVDNTLKIAIETDEDGTETVVNVWIVG